MPTHIQISMLVILATCLCLPGCKRENLKKVAISQAEMDRNFELASMVDKFVWDGPTFLTDKSIARIRAMAPLKSEKVTFENNPNDEGHKLEFHLIEFDGLELNGIVQNGEFSPLSVVITDPKWQVLHGLNVGTPASKIPKAIGHPQRQITGPVEEFSGETQTVRFYVKNGKISKVEFVYYFD